MNDLERHYNQRALAEDEISLTYNHPSLYKQWFYRARFHRVFSALNPQRSEKILEIGSGSGYYTKAIAEITNHLTATEFSKEYLEVTKKYNPYPVDAYIHCSATKMPFSDNTFNKILITEVIEHIPEWNKAIDEVRRVLKPGGIAIITTPNKLSHMNIAYVLKRKIRRYAFNEHVHEFTRNEFLRELKKRFNVVGLEYVNFLLPYPLDIHWTNHSPSPIIIKILDAIEKWIQNSKFFSRIGWTMVASVTKLQ